MKNRDTLYQNPLNQIADFEFDEKVVRVFPDMLHRSIPGYATLIRMLGVLAQKYAGENSTVYDLGCSLGAASFAVASGISDHHCTLIAVDQSRAMCDRMQSLVAESSEAGKIDIICADIREVPFKPTSMVMLNFTLQFIPVVDRKMLLQKIYDALVPGGCLVLSEKIKMQNEEEDRVMIDLHEGFKRANGYSDLEISQKRSALERVLIPETESEHLTRLSEAGFGSCYCWFRCLNFISLVAVK